MVTKLHKQLYQDKKKVFIVDDHPIVRDGLTQMINQEADMVVCATAEDAYQGMEMIKKSKPDIAIIDISLKGMSGIELIKNVKTHCPMLPILVLSMHDESFYAERVLRAGARGYIMKQEATEKVLVAIRCILNGQIYTSEKMASLMMERLLQRHVPKSDSPVDCLSDRELEVLQFIGKGYGTSQIAKEIHLSVKTIETYRENIKEKMNLPNARELVRYAIQWAQSVFPSLNP